MLMRVALLAALVAAGAGIAACGSSSKSPAASTSNTSSSRSSTTGGTTAGTRPGVAAALGDTAWTLTSYLNTAGAATPAAPGKAATLAFASDNTFTGSTGCNSFSGQYTASGSNLKLTIGPMTRIACSGPVALQEGAVTSGFPKVVTYSVGAGNLLLDDAQHVTLFTYTSQPSGIAGTAWRVTGVNNGKGAVSASQLTSRLTAAFGADEQFDGFGGCNQMSGPYTTSEKNDLTIGPLSSQQKACAADVMDLENQYAVALSKVSTYDISGDTLTLRDGSGATQITATQMRTG
jgi:heat shock protein HslJ